MSDVETREALEAVVKAFNRYNNVIGCQGSASMEEAMEIAWSYEALYRVARRAERLLGSDVHM